MNTTTRTVPIAVQDGAATLAGLAAIALVNATLRHAVADARTGSGTW